MRIVFIHPDLGIGGAERLVIDAGKSHIFASTLIYTISSAALALKECGNRINILTNHHDSSHCFPETIDGSLDVTVAGSWFPRRLFGRFYAMCAYIRIMIATLYLILWEPVDSDLFDFDVVFCDQISIPIPILKIFSFWRNGRTPKIIFYCHFPDLLLTDRNHILKKIYRYPIDWLEERMTGSADKILVNSKFTESVFRQTFPSLQDIPLHVVYPTCNLSAFDKPVEELVLNPKPSADILFLSINRFERKKNLNLAIQSVARLHQMLQDIQSRKTVHLIIAGGYDEKLPENLEYLIELEKVASDLDVKQMISFLKSPSDRQKQALLHNCTAVIYTPEKEHFGIVPLEAMYMKRPVIACRSGGPVETVIDGETGFLCDPLPETFAAAMLKFLQDKSLAREMGIEGHQHVIRKFSYDAFRNNLQETVANLKSE